MNTPLMENVESQSGGASMPVSPRRSGATAVSVASPRGERSTTRPPRLDIEARAVSVSFLRSFTDERCKADALVQTTRDVVKRVIIPVTMKAGKVRYVDLWEVRNHVDRTGCDITESGIHALGCSVFFVSHSWDSSWEDLVAALEAHRGRFVAAQLSSQRDPESVVEEPYYWVDVLAINQHYGSEEQSEDLPDWDQMNAEEDGAHADTEGSGFRRVIRKSTQGVVMVLEPWISPQAVGRVWCLFEAFTGVNTGARRLEVCVSPAQQQNLQDTIFTNFVAIFKLLSTLDLRSARATVASDWDHICKLVLNTEGGFDTINAALQRELGRWLAESTQEALDRIDPDRQWSEDELAKESKWARRIVKRPRLPALMTYLVGVGYVFFAGGPLALLYAAQHPEASKAIYVAGGVAFFSSCCYLGMCVLPMHEKVEKALKESRLPSVPLCLCGAHTPRVAGPFLRLVVIACLLAWSFTFWHMAFLYVEMMHPEWASGPSDSAGGIALSGAFYCFLVLEVVCVVVILVALPTQNGLEARELQLTLMARLADLRAMQAGIARGDGNSNLRQSTSHVDSTALRSAAVDLYQRSAAGRRDLLGRCHPRTVYCLAGEATQLRLLGKQAEAETVVQEGAQPLLDKLNSSCGDCLDYWFGQGSWAPVNIYLAGERGADGTQSRAWQRLRLAQLYASAGETYRSEAVEQLGLAGQERTSRFLASQITTRPYTTEKQLNPSQPGLDWLWANEREACEACIQNVADSERSNSGRRAQLEKFFGLKFITRIFWSCLGGLIASVATGIMASEDSEGSGA